MNNLDIKSKNESIAKSSEKRSESKNAQGQGKSGFFMFNPVLVQQCLQKSLMPGIKHIMVFQNIEGSLIAKASNSTEEQFDQMLGNS